MYLSMIDSDNRDVSPYQFNSDIDCNVTHRIRSITSNKELIVHLTMMTDDKDSFLNEPNIDISFL